VDHPVVQAVIGAVRDRKVVTYGFSLQADICGVNVRSQDGGNTFDVIVRQRGLEDRRIEGVHLPMPGRHNVQNALAAIAVAIEMGCSDEVIRTGFARFGGVRRRFTKVGSVDLAGGAVTVIDDYAHHPVEIRAVLAAAREAVGSSGGRVPMWSMPRRSIPRARRPSRGSIPVRWSPGSRRAGTVPRMAFPARTSWQTCWPAL